MILPVSVSFVVFIAASARVEWNIYLCILYMSWNWYITQTHNLQQYFCIKPTLRTRTGDAIRYLYHVAVTIFIILSFASTRVESTCNVRSKDIHRHVKWYRLIDPVIFWLQYQKCCYACFMITQNCQTMIENTPASTIFILSIEKWSRMQPWDVLTHWGRVMHICANILTNIQIMACRCQAINWTNAEILLIGNLRKKTSMISQAKLTHFHSGKCIWKRHVLHFASDSMC